MVFVYLGECAARVLAPSYSSGVDIGNGNGMTTTYTYLANTELITPFVGKLAVYVGMDFVIVDSEEEAVQTWRVCHPRENPESMGGPYSFEICLDGGKWLYNKSLTFIGQKVYAPPRWGRAYSR